VFYNIGLLAHWTFHFNHRHFKILLSKGRYFTDTFDAIHRVETPPKFEGMKIAL
jgi:hypothetical protein